MENFEVIEPEAPFHDCADEFPHNFNTVPSVFEFSFAGLSEVISEVEKADNFVSLLSNAINYLEKSRDLVGEDNVKEVVFAIKEELDIIAFSNVAKSSVIAV